MLNKALIKKHKYKLIALLACVIVLLVWVFRPSPGYDINKVAPELAQLQEPYKVVAMGYYQDGGTVGVIIEDAIGRCDAFCLPAPLGDPDPYSRIYVGGQHYTQAGTREIVGYPDTKNKLLEIMKDYRQMTWGDDICIASASGSQLEALKLAWRIYVSRCNDPNYRP